MQVSYRPFGGEAVVSPPPPQSPAGLTTWRRSMLRNLTIETNSQMTMVPDGPGWDDASCAHGDVFSLIHPSPAF